LEGAEKDKLLDTKIDLVKMGVSGAGSGSCSMAEVGITGV
jgi:hypothetical protein